MPRTKSNSVFGFLTKKRETYHRDVKAERAELKRQAAARDREEKSELRRLAIAEKKRKAERRKADAVDRKIEKEWRNKGYRNPAKRSQRNPVDSAAALSEAWHGRPASTETDYVERVHFHGVLTDLGRLQEIKVMVTQSKAQAICFDKATRLCSSENGKQLYVVGGDQSLDLSLLGIDGEEAEKDLVVVGEAYSLTYVTSKNHLGKADRIPGPYEHVLGEDGGEPPLLVYDTLNQSVGFAGGSYKIDPTDYDGQHSAGIRN